ncbi:MULTISPECIES: lytic transglycosylase domain-containing protein [unclassified Lysobacter]|uniref:lytic transglycosylase domain-containing protein n=1 Tax=unclassified Lysobacter TaxID=2635362 RepID=UPI001BEC1299|nr:MULTISPECIES: lytic transglycosylase domain-containing protein [unclassified Lysobacter]MBT2745445.1 lytic transglycosylase domain-containing protein [Lysobacter sp. ISL-42]MBT2776987.1 lytic transglycosylase domain-containing protein [Lysobacter sp. ISL-54]MBT2781507.1 lytic transglycosylase domain-containing protein [Lysobacter sp. ISL-52]
MRGHALILGTVCLLALAPAVAGTVWKCESASGERSYVSKKVKGQSCVVASQYTALAKRMRNPTPVSYAPPAPAVGSLTTRTDVAGVPGSIHNNPPATFSGAAAAMAAGGLRPTLPAAGASATAGTAVAPAPMAAIAPMPQQPPTRLVQGQVYSYIQDGVRHYTSKRPKGLASATAVRTIRYSFIETCFACAARPGVNFGTLRLNTAAFSAEIAAAARQHGVEEAIVRAIIHAESAYNPNAMSRVGAQGLMQLMPATARRFGVGNAFDANQNIQGGVQYLAWLLKRFNGDLTLAAAGYNAGEGAVDKYRGVPPYAETQRYVQRVAVLAQRYRSAVVAR